MKRAKNLKKTRILIVLKGKLEERGPIIFHFRHSGAGSMQITEIIKEAERQRSQFTLRSMINVCERLVLRFVLGNHLLVEQKPKRRCQINVNEHFINFNFGFAGSN